MDVQKEWLEAVLKKKAYEESPIKILEFEDGDSGPGKGEHYLSKILKIKAKVLLGSGRIKKVSFLAKCEHETEQMKKMSSELGLFVREITMYRDVLPKMQELLEEINDPEGIFWAKCHDIRLYDRIIFEDLRESGFRMADRFEQLGLNTALLTLKHFAKFHALSRVLMDRGEIPLDIFKAFPFHNGIEAIERSKKSIEENMTKMAQKMETWGDEWKEAIERMKAAASTVPERVFAESFTVLPNQFTALCHCDAWTNNIMFKGEDLENPTELRLVDLQTCTVASPAKDVSQFLQTSVRLEVRINHTDLLVQTYADTLKSYLSKLNYKGEIPTVDDIKLALARLAPLCFCDSISFVPIIVLAAPDQAVDFEKLMEKEIEMKEKGEEAAPLFDLDRELTPVAINLMKYEIKEAMKLGVF